MDPNSFPPSAALRLTREDFAATRPDAPARQRKAVESRLFTWAGEVTYRLAARFGAFEVHAVRDPDGEGSGVVFVRALFARKALEELAEESRPLRPRMGEAPYLPHLHVALVVYEEALELRVDVPARAWADIENLRARLADPGALLELISSLELLPEAFELAEVPGPPPCPAHLVSGDELRARVESARANQASLRILWRIPREVVLGFTEDLGEALEDALFALLSAAKLIAWADDNDALGLRARAEGRRQRPVFRDEFRDEGGAGRAFAVPSERAPRRPPRDEEELRPRRARDQEEAASEAAPSVPPGELKARSLRPVPARLARKILRRASRAFDVDPSQPVEKGTHVQVLAGPFAGRAGIVFELDGKGEARVMLGLLTTRVAVRFLVPCSPRGAGRPQLSSSHRKNPAR